MSTYKIADLIVSMESFGRTAKQAEPYKIDTDLEPEIVIESAPEAMRERNPHLTLNDCEYLSTGGSFYRQICGFNGILLHASCVVVDGMAYLFTAPCGTGKSTHVRLWLKLFGDRAYILNDDKPALRVKDGEVYVYGTPWSGKEDCSRNERVRLGGIAVVKRAQDNAIKALDTNSAIYALLNQTVRSLTPRLMLDCMDTIGKIVSNRKVYELSCNMDISAAKLSYETMSEKRFNYED